MYIPQRVLVTGGGGYIGSVLVRNLLHAGYLVTVLDNFQGSDIGLRELRNHHQLKIIDGDLRDPATTKKSLLGIDLVIHLAGVSDGRQGRKNPELTNEVNYISFVNLLEEAVKSQINRFLFASTFGVYGNDYHCPLTEELPLNPAEVYSKSKANGEALLERYNSDDFITVSLRLAMVYGFSPRMRFDFIVNRLILDALQTGRITILGGTQKRPQIHIQDVAEYFIELLKAPPKKISGQTFNAGGENISLGELADTILMHLEEPVEVQFKPVRANENTFELDCEKISSVLHLTPRKSIKNAVVEIKEKYKANYWKELVN